MDGCYYPHSVGTTKAKEALKRPKVSASRLTLSLLVNGVQSSNPSSNNGFSFWRLTLGEPGRSQPASKLHSRKPRPLVPSLDSKSAAWNRLIQPLLSPGPNLGTFCVHSHTLLIAIAHSPCSQSPWDHPSSQKPYRFPRNPLPTGLVGCTRAPS